MDLLALLREFGADDALIALAETWSNRADEGAEPMSDDDLTALLTGLQGLADDDEAGVGLLVAAADEADAIRGEQATREEQAAAEDAAAAEAAARLRGEAPEASEQGDEPAE